MFVGTCSDAGKSILSTAFCRILKQDGYHPAPFKAQNMSLNSFSTAEGGEMGRAQVVQAEACGIAPHTDMNPVLLKPMGDSLSQVIVRGKAVGNLSARDYFAAKSRKETLFREAAAAFHRLESRYNPIVMEGAGSISELNLREGDITNMRMAIHAGASTFLVADIDRGGVFGSVYGTTSLLRPEERERIKGIIINKFRGDASLFAEGRKMLTELTGIPVVGVIPWFDDIRIEAEDSVALSRKTATWQEDKINVAVVLLRHMSNFTDFDALDMDPRFNPYFTNRADEIERADIVILPGTKNTLADLRDIRESGVADAVTRAFYRGKKVIGICGGYQMMGMRVEDPEGMEGGITALAGLGLLPLGTVIGREKTTRQSRFTFRTGSPLACRGYEIHMGRTAPLPGAAASPVARLPGGRTDGCFLSDRCWGSYMHGILDNAEVRDSLARGLLSPAPAAAPLDYAAFKEEQYDRLAALVRTHLDMPYIYSTL